VITGRRGALFILEISPGISSTLWQIGAAPRSNACKKKQNKAASEKEG